MKKLSLVLLLSVLGVVSSPVGLHSQSPPSQQVFQVLTTGASANYFSPAVRNIGQPYHSATAVLRDAPGQTCTVPNVGANQVTLDLTGGYVNSSAIIPDITTSTRITAGGTALYRFQLYANGQGVYQSVKVSLINFDTTHCVADVYYTGTFYPTSIKLDPSYPGTVVASALSLDQGLSLGGVNTAGATTTDLTATVAGFTPRLYYLSIYSAASQNITILESVNGTAFITLTAFGGAGSAPYILPLTGNAYFASRPSGKLQVTTSAGTSVNVSLLYAFE